MWLELIQWVSYPAPREQLHCIVRTKSKHLILEQRSTGEKPCSLLVLKPPSHKIFIYTYWIITVWVHIFHSYQNSHQPIQGCEGLGLRIFFLFLGKRLSEWKIFLWPQAFLNLLKGNGTTFHWWKRFLEKIQSGIKKKDSRFGYVKAAASVREQDGEGMSRIE